MKHGEENVMVCGSLSWHWTVTESVIQFTNDNLHGFMYVSNWVKDNHSSRLVSIKFGSKSRLKNIKNNEVQMKCGY